MVEMDIYALEYGRYALEMSWRRQNMVEMDIYALEYGRYALEMSWRRQNSANRNENSTFL